MDTADLQLYEAVEKMAPFSRKLLVLVGPRGVGRRALVRRIVKHDTKLFDTTKAGQSTLHTSCCSCILVDSNFNEQILSTHVS